ncbi:MAG: hypothetical protein ACRC35_11895 [Angustibacter sp.]
MTATTPLVAATPAIAANLDCGSPQRFDDPGAGLVEWTAPAGTEEVRITAAGGRGGDATAVETLQTMVIDEFDPRTPAGGGRGAVVTDVFAAAEGDTLLVTVGGGADGPDGGSNGGGDAATGPFTVPGDGGEPPMTVGGGGGASDVRRGGSDLADRIVVAAGGGGAGAVTWPSTERTGGAPIPAAPPDLLGEGGDAGQDGGVSQGRIGYDPGDPVADPGIPVAGRTRVTNGNFLEEIGSITPGVAGSANVGGAGGDHVLPPATSPFYPRSTGGAGSLGQGGSGGRTLDPSDLILVATAGGGGGGGVHGGGGGAGIGSVGSSEPIPTVVSGGAGGSSLGTVTGLNATIDGYVEIVACVRAAASTAPPTSPAPSPGAGPGGGGASASGDPTLKAGQQSDGLPATGPAPLPLLVALGAGLVVLGGALARAARHRRER